MLACRHALDSHVSAGRTLAHAAPRMTGKHTRTASQMMNLTLGLSPRVREALDWIVRGDSNHEPDDWNRRCVLVDLILDHARQLREGTHRQAGDEAAHPEHREQLDAVRRERDALRQALEVERSNRRGVLHRLSAARTKLNNTLGVASRLRASRDRYQDLALRIEAALYNACPRNNVRRLERRINLALQDLGRILPARVGDNLDGSGDGTPGITIDPRLKQSERSHVRQYTPAENGKPLQMAAQRIPLTSEQRENSAGVVRKDGTGCEEDDRKISTAIPLSADRATSIGRMREILTDIADRLSPTKPTGCRRAVPDPASRPSKPCNKSPHPPQISTGTCKVNSLAGKLDETPRDDDNDPLPLLTEPLGPI